MVDVAQLVSASDCGSEGRGFESPHPPHLLMCPLLERGACALFRQRAAILGCRQAVRHQTLTLAFAGSNPASPAIYDSLAQLVEQRPFKAKVRGSSPRRVTKTKSSPKGLLFVLRRGREPRVRCAPAGAISEANRRLRRLLGRRCPRRPLESSPKGLLFVLPQGSENTGAPSLPPLCKGRWIAAKQQDGGVVRLPRARSSWQVLPQRRQTSAAEQPLSQSL